MIIDKKIRFTNNGVSLRKSEYPKPEELPEEYPPYIPDDPNVTIETVQANPIEQVYLATRRVLNDLRVIPGDTNSPRLFHTIRLDTGQFDRIMRSKSNEEYAVAFPAAFIRFVNVRYLVVQQRIGEGRATMRIRFILNDLNNNDDVVETHGFRVFQQINEAIQDAKSKEPALNERCNLLYFDMPESSENGLQAYWVDYEIWFRQTSGFQYRNWVDRYLVMPPFTNHEDAPEHDAEQHGNHKTPTMDEASGFTSNSSNPNT